jgi:hypothetical protein
MEKLFFPPKQKIKQSFFIGFFSKFKSLNFLLFLGGIFHREKRNIKKEQILINYKKIGLFQKICF